MKEYNKTLEAGLQELDKIPHGAPLSARGDYVSVVNAKSFLTSFAEKIREGVAQELVKKIEELEVMGIGGDFGEGYEAGHKKALSDLLAQLKKI